MHAKPPERRTNAWREKIERSRYFFLALLLHLIILLMIATLIIWPAPAPTPTYAFNAVAVQVPPPPPPPPPVRLPSGGSAASYNPHIEPTVEVHVVTPPSPITTLNNSAFKLDTSRIMSQALSKFSDQLG